MINQEIWIEKSPELYNIAEKLASLYRLEIEKAGAVATGRLKNFDWNIKLDQDTLKLVFTLPDYYYYIEKGRKPTKRGEGGVLVKAIYEWIQDKGITPKTKVNKKTGKKYQPTQKQLAYAIANAIHQQGYFRPGHYGKKPLELAMNYGKQQGLKDQFLQTVGQMLGREVHDEILTLQTK